MVKRREVIASSTVAVSALTGCIGGGGGDGNGDGTSPETRETTVGESGDSPIRIGSLHPLAPPTTDLAESERNGIRLAEQKINSEGGINGREIEVLTRNSEANPDTGFQKAQNLVEGQNVDMLFGDIISSTSIAISEWIGGPNIPYFTPASADTLTGESCQRQMFVLNESERMQSRAMAPWMVERSGPRGYLHVWDFAWGHSLQESYTNVLAEISQDTEVVASTTSPLTETDFSSAVSQIASSEADWVFLGFAAAGLSTFLKQAAQFGLKDDIDIYGAEATKSARQAASDAIQETGYVIDYDPEFDTDANREFTNMYADAHDDEPSQWSMRAWEAVHCYKEAVEAAGTTDTDPVIDQLEQVEFDAPMGSLSFRECDHRNFRDVHTGMVGEPSEYGVPGFDILDTTPASDAMPPCEEIPCDL